MGKWLVTVERTLIVYAESEEKARQRVEDRSSIGSCTVIKSIRRAEKEGHVDVAEKEEAG